MLLRDLRCSEDLDFTVREATQIEEGFLKATFADVAQWFSTSPGSSFRSSFSGSRCTRTSAGA